MEKLRFPNYLSNPLQVRQAVKFLDENCLNPDFLFLFRGFEKALGIKSGEGFPITRAYLSGHICRARVNNDPSEFVVAENVSQISTNLKPISPGRANPLDLPVFYAANNKETACFEVLQEKDSGLYKLTIGCWKSPRELCVANLLDGSDPDLSSLSFAHSMPRKYSEKWPEMERQSTLILSDYFREKFKMVQYNGLYMITNVIAGVCYSLGGVDGIGYASVSNKYKGYNIALKDYSMLTCDSVEEWLVNKISDDTLENRLLRTGSVEPDGRIIWNSLLL
jgi:hypothetical protein